MTEQARIPLAGVIGSPVSHSLSPKLHTYWLRTLGRRGYYIPMDVSQADLETVLRDMPKMGFVGANITIPHKEAVMRIADLVTDRATLIGACNTLIFRRDGFIHADNTDGYGFLHNLRENAPGWDPRAAPAAVIGAGGAARAVLAALSEAGVPEIRVSNRTRARAEVLHEDFGNRVVVYDWVQAGNILEGCGTVVNASSMGMVGKPEFRVPLDGLSPKAVVSDLVYTPLETDFLRRAREIGCTVVDGLGMLLYQAVPGFERWFGKRPEVTEDVRRMMLGS